MSMNSRVTKIAKSVLMKAAEPKHVSYQHPKRVCVFTQSHGSKSPKFRAARCDSQSGPLKLEVRGWCLPPASGGTPQTPQKSFKLESLLWPQKQVILGRPWCQGKALVPGKPEESVVGHFCGRESNCQILCRSLELLVWCFQK